MTEGPTTEAGRIAGQQEAWAEWFASDERPRHVNLERSAFNRGWDAARATERQRVEALAEALRRTSDAVHRLWHVTTTSKFTGWLNCPLSPCADDRALITGAPQMAVIDDPIAERAAEVAIVRQVIESEYRYSPQERAEQIIDQLSARPRSVELRTRALFAALAEAPAPSGNHDYRPLDPARLYCRSCGRVILSR